MIKSRLEAPSWRTTCKFLRFWFYVCFVRCSIPSHHTFLLFICHQGTWKVAPNHYRPSHGTQTSQPSAGFHPANQAHSHRPVASSRQYPGELGIGNYQVDRSAGISADSGQFVRSAGASAAACVAIVVGTGRHCVVDAGDLCVHE